MWKGKKKFLLSSSITTGVIILLVILFSFIFFRTSKSRTLDFLMEVSNQGVKLIQQEVKQNQMLLRNLAIFMEEGKEDPAALREKLVPVEENNHFRRMGFVTEDGTSYTTDHTDLSFASETQMMERFRPGIEGRECVVDGFEDLELGDPVTIYQAPFTTGEGMKCTLFATYGNEYYQEILSVSTFGGEGYSYIIKENGDRVVGDFDNLFRALEGEGAGNRPAVQQMRQGMESHQSGYVKLKDDGGMRYIYYQPLEINDWYLLSVVPGSVIRKDVNIILALAYGMTFLCICLMLYLTGRVRGAENSYWKKLEDTALKDRVTGLPSFERFKSDAKDLISEAGNGTYAMVCFNILMFQYVNELYGYKEGDRVLSVVGAGIRESLKDGELAARINADRFAAILRYDGREEIRSRAMDIIEKLETRAESSRPGMEYEIIMTAGVYVIEDPDEVVDKMVDRAKAAFTKEIRGTLENCGFYDNAIRDRAVRQREMENHFEAAMAQGEFLVYYQPKYDVKEKRFHGAEALVRWNWQKESMMPPGEFIPVFESNGMIVQLDEYMFRETCRQVKAWLDAGIPVDPVSVNISRLHLYQKNFVDTYLDIIRETGVPAKAVSLELTETVLFHNEGILNEALERFRDAGIQILMDDFGSGYSSIQLLSVMPIDMLKLDKSLVDNSTDNLRIQAALRSVVSLARTFGIDVIAEGVETKEQYDLLETMGINYIQGYYCAKPMAGDEYERLIREQEASK